MPSKFILTKFTGGGSHFICKRWLRGSTCDLVSDNLEWYSVKEIHYTSTTWWSTVAGAWTWTWLCWCQIGQTVNAKSSSCFLSLTIHETSYLKLSKPTWLLINPHNINLWARPQCVQWTFSSNSASVTCWVDDDSSFHQSLLHQHGIMLQLKILFQPWGMNPSL